KISIGTIPVGTKFVTLKGNTVNAAKDMLFIKSEANLSTKDERRSEIKSSCEPVALAGIMGGADSEIKADTRDTVFEVATFNAANIRRTSVAVGLRTDASARYEKSLDPQTNLLAGAEILRLVNKYAKNAKVVSSFAGAVRGNRTDPISQEITVKKDYLERFAGVKFNYKSVEKHLTGLGFRPVITDTEIKVTVPSYRNWKDITTPADVIEEIVRNFGYQNIKPTAPAVAVKPVLRDSADIFDDDIKDLLALKYGYSEVHTNIWYNTQACKALNISPISHLSVINSFVRSDDKIRSEMLTSMLSATIPNKTANEIRIFEIGRVITGLDKNGNGVEEKHLGGLSCIKTVAAEDVYAETAKMLADIFKLCGLRLSYKIGGTNDEKFHPKNNAGIYVGDKKIGEFGIVNPRVLKDTVGFEINLSVLDWANPRQVVAQKISKFPKTELDFTFIWNGIYAELLAILQNFKNEFVQNTRLSAVYTDPTQSNENRFTMTFTVGSFEKTLTGDEIGAIHGEIMRFAETKGVKIVK
ncbi:MAG: hypothetical protein LBQ05_02780, partial [Christensenellaceae bacterium]|nr:hypothetical protein [Christensenellaceae bacterium]